MPPALIPPLLATRQEVYDMLDTFDGMDSADIRKFFEDNNVSSSGVVDYGRLMCGGALTMKAKTDEEALVLMQALFSAGVVLGIKLANKRDEAKRTATLHVLRPPAAHE